jgi:hypothetical protein
VATIVMVFHRQSFQGGFLRWGNRHLWKTRILVKIYWSRRLVSCSFSDWTHIHQSPWL